MNLQQGEIYLITNRINQKKYVGQTTSFFPSGRRCGTNGRWGYHVYRSTKGKNDCPSLGNAIKKYGKHGFTIETLLICNKNMLDYYERKFIHQYGSLSPNGYNIESGGSKSKNLHLDTRKLISSKKRFMSVSETNKQRILLSMRELSIDELPFGIHFSCDSKTGYEGFSLHQNGNVRSFVAKGRTLTEKLEQVLTYMKICEENNVEEKANFDNKINEQSLILQKKAKMKKINARAKEAMVNLGVEDLPLYVRYENRGSRFYVHFPGEGSRYFRNGDPEKSLRDALNYVKETQKRESVGEESQPQ